MSLQEQIDKAKEKLKEIVIPDGIDAGVVLLSNDGPTHWSEEHQCFVYEHEYFSPLGDALIELWNILNGETND